jgi:hypothetical protein
MKANLVLLLAMLPWFADAAIDLTPRYIDTYNDGIVFQRLYFTDGEKKFTVRSNRETVVTGESGGAMFRFTKLPNSSFQILRSRLTPEQLFSGTALEQYREAAKRLLPVLAKASSIREETVDPLPINNWKGYRLILSCDLNGKTYLQSVTFLNLTPTDQVVLVTTAPEATFQEAADRSFQIIRTWQELLPGDERPAPYN